MESRVFTILYTSTSGAPPMAAKNNFTYANKTGKSCPFDAGAPYPKIVGEDHKK